MILLPNWDHDSLTPFSFLPQKTKQSKQKKRAVCTDRTSSEVLDWNSRVWQLGCLDVGSCPSLELFLDFVVMLEEVLEIRSVSLRCCNDTKAFCADYYSLCIIVRLKPQKVPHGGMSTFFWHEYIITLAAATEIFLDGAHFFLPCLKCGSNSIKLTDFSLLPASQHKTLLTPCLVTVATVRDSGRGMRGDWVVQLNHWLISDLITELITCFVSHCVSVTDAASGIVVNKWTREHSVIWMHKETWARKSLSFRNETACVLEIMIYFFN